MPPPVPVPVPAPPSGCEPFRLQPPPPDVSPSSSDPPATPGSARGQRKRSTKGGTSTEAVAKRGRVTRAVGAIGEGDGARCVWRDVGVGVEGVVGGLDEVAAVNEFAAEILIKGVEQAGQSLAPPGGNGAAGGGAGGVGEEAGESPWGHDLLRLLAKGQEEGWQVEGLEKKTAVATSVRGIWVFAMVGNGEGRGSGLLLENVLEVGEVGLGAGCGGDGIDFECLDGGSSASEGIKGRVSTAEDGGSERRHRWHMWRWAGPEQGRRARCGGGGINIYDADA